MKRNENGFSAVEAILVLVIVGLIGVVGFMVYKNHNKTNSTTTASTTKSSTAPTKTTPDPYEGWNAYSSKDLGFQLKYPKDWKFQDLTPSKDRGCPPVVDDYKATGCPLLANVKPSELPDNLGGAAFVGVNVYSGSTASLDDLFNQDKAAYEGTANSKKVTVNGLQGYVVEQVTTGSPKYTRELYMFQLGSGTYLNIYYDKTYESQDFSKYLNQVQNVIDSVQKY